jgi:hypothetical protein
MAKGKVLFKKALIIPGKSVEVYACGGQCRGKNSSTLPLRTDVTVVSKENQKIKVS